MLPWMGCWWAGSFCFRRPRTSRWCWSVAGPWSHSPGEEHEVENRCSTYSTQYMFWSKFLQWGVYNMILQCTYTVPVLGYWYIRVYITVYIAGLDIGLFVYIFALSCCLPCSCTLVVNICLWFTSYCGCYRVDLLTGGKIIEITFKCILFIWKYK